MTRILSSGRKSSRAWMVRAGSEWSMRVSTPSVTTSMRVFGPTRVSIRIRYPTVRPGERRAKAGDDFEDREVGEPDRHLPIVAFFEPPSREPRRRWRCRKVICILEAVPQSGVRTSPNPCPS